MIIDQLWWMVLTSGEVLYYESSLETAPSMRLPYTIFESSSKRAHDT